MMRKILMVDDDQNILQGYERSLRKQFSIDTALGARAAIQMLTADDGYAVVVADMNMPGINGIELLQRTKEISPDTIRMMLTGNADMTTAIDAVNKGNVFRFLVKPIAAEDLAAAINAGLDQHHLVTAERELLGKTVRGSIRVLLEILSTLAPALFGQSQVVKHHVKMLGEHLRAPEVLQMELAAMLSQIGVVTLTPNVLKQIGASGKLTGLEEEMLARVPEISSNLLKKIPRLESVAEMILYQSKNFDGTGNPPTSVAGEAIPLGGRVLKIVAEMVQNEADGKSRRESLEAMAQKPESFDPDLVQSAVSCFSSASAQASKTMPQTPVLVAHLKVGHLLASDIETVDGKLLISGGHEISETLLARINNYASISRIREPLYIIGGRDEHQRA